MTADLIVVGTSLGGTHALQVLLGALPAGFPVPILVVVHRGRDSGTDLCAQLQKCCRLVLHEAEDKDTLLPGHVYVAPPDYHLLVEGRSLALSTEAAVNYSRPSVDVLFESAAEARGQNVLGVILTGTGSDGAHGCARLEERGGTVIVQDPATAESPSMPTAALAAAPGATVLALEQIPAVLVSLAAWENVP